METGGSPQTAIREDVQLNVPAIEEMNKKFPQAELCFVRIGRKQPCGNLQSRTRRPDDLHG